MADRVAEARARYGGRWTSEKLDILETYQNSTNAPLFEFLFCVGSRGGKAIGTAQRIASHILENL